MYSNPETSGELGIVEIVPEEGIYLTMKALLKPQDRVIAINPVYQSLVQVAQHIGCAIDLWEVEEDYKYSSSSSEGCNGELFLSLEKLTQLFANGSKVRLLIVNFPHNPTGFVPSQAFYNEIVELCR